MTRKSANQMRYLSQAIQLEEAVNPAIIKNTMMTISLAIITFTAWSAFTNINEVARTPGEVVPAGYQQVVQHLEGGIVGKINVSEGDIVEKGQVVLELNGTGINEDLKRAQAKQTTLLMQEERLRAYIEGRKPDFSRYNADNTAAIRDQENFFASMENNNSEEKNVIRNQIEQKKRMILSLQSELQTARNTLSLSTQLFDRRTELHAKGFLSETKYLEAKQNINAIKGDISQIENRISIASAEINEYKNRLTSLAFNQNDEINERLDAVIAEKSQHEELLQKLSDRAERLAVRAPVSGIIKGLSVNTIGAIVKPGDTLTEIVPVNDNLMVQVKIEPQHIGHVRVGQPVKVKLSSYDFSRYGLIDGKLEHISATTFSAQDGSRYYQARIKLDKNYVGKDIKNHVLPGMTVMAEIITGEKTILQYLLKPVHNSLKTAFSER